jgi:hypothetical protein
MSIISKDTRLTGLILALTLVLSACGGSGGSSGPSSAPAKVNFEIANATGDDFKRILIIDRASGDVVYNQEFYCGPFEKECMVYYAGPAIKGSAVLEFKDGAGKILAHYDTASIPGVYVNAEVSNFTTGAFLYDELLVRNSSLTKMTAGDLTYRLRLYTSLNPTTNSDTIYEQLASHYRYHQSVKSTSPSVFVSKLGQNLMDGKIAGQTEFVIVNPPAKAKASANSAGCPPGFSMMFDMLADMLGEAFGGYGLKPFINQVGKISSDACKPGDNTLGQILDALNNLQNSVDNIQNNLGALSNFLAKSKLEEKIKAYDSTTKDLVGLSENYKNLLRLNGVSNLKEYVEKNYGKDGLALDRALTAENVSSVLNVIIEVSGGNRSGGFLKNIDQLTAGDITFIDGLNLLCADQSGVGDLLELRSLCNMAISSTVARLAANHAMALILAGDGYAVFDAYPSTARRYGYDVKRGATAYKQALTDAFFNQKNSLATSYQSIRNSDGSAGYFKLLNGLSAPLLANLKSVNCYDTKEKTYLISGWVKDASNEYLITNCNAFVEGPRSTTYPFPIPVQARYFLKVNNTVVSNTDSVANILGVLIPTSNKDPRARKLPSTNSQQAQLIALKPSYDPIPGTFTSNGLSLKGATPNIVNSNLTDGPSERLRPYLTPWTNQILTANGLALYNHEGSVYEGIDNWLRYTDKNFMSYVFTLNTFGDSVSLYCVMTDCTSNYFKNTISFKYGVEDLGLNFADPRTDLRLLKGWTIGGQFIDAK